MNREIKFRAWIKSQKKIINVYGFSRDNISETSNDSPCLNENIFNFNDCELMQYTGLKDIEGTEIYEGDIVLRNETGCEGSYNAKYKVIYKKNSFCLEVLQSYIFKKGTVLCVMEECDVVGNIYENPELLQI